MEQQYERLQKYISECGIMSRRAAEREIEAGNVRVNGKVASLGDKINPDTDTVELDGVKIEKKPNGERKFKYLMLNKPSGYLTTLSDDRNRPCVASLVENCGTRVNPAGRLDLDSEGLLLFTNDGELLNHLTHPRFSLPKVYIVTIYSSIAPEQLDTLRSPMELDGYKLRPIECRLISSMQRKTVLKITLHEGRNRQIRRMCEQAGLRVTELCRVSIGDIELGTLPVGKWRYLTDDEVEYLKRETAVENI